MRKRFIFLFLIFIVLFCILINQKCIKYVYVSPQVNTSVLPHINKEIRHVEQNLQKTIYACQKEYRDIKFNYVNYYGSGFLKENQIPNDLDISVGVDLGTYEFNGNNIEQIAKEIEDKIQAFHIYTITSFIADKKNKYVVNKSEINVLTELQQEKSTTIKNITNGLNEVLNNKVQVLHFNKKYKENDVDYTFILGKNEVLVNEILPFFAYTSGLKYNKTMVDYPREITILPDFYVNIKNTKTNETKQIELIEESFLGERFQLSRRFFVPIVFTGNHSLKYLKNLDYLKNDEQYIQTRLFNYFRYLNEVELYFEYVLDNVKLMKRMHQCADIIVPALSEEEKTLIYTDIKNVLSNKDIQFANYYSNSLKNLSLMSANRYIFEKALEYNYIQDLVESSNLALEELSKNKKYEKEIEKLKKYQYQYLMILKSVTNEQQLAQFHQYLDDIFIDISVNITKIINSNIENRQKFLKDYEILKQITQNAGFHKIEIYQYDIDKIYVVKNDFTKNFSSNDLKLLAKENHMPEAEYNLINSSKIKKGSRSEIKYVRYNSTEAENKAWEELKNKLLQDKKNFKIKRKYIF